ncbi:hypothetical protein VPHK469_0228 [Vibrio phage K469]
MLSNIFNKELLLYLIKRQKANAPSASRKGT